MTALGIIGLILGIIVMIVFAYWGLNAVPLACWLAQLSVFSTVSIFDRLRHKLGRRPCNCIFSLLHFILCFYMFCEYHG